MKKIIVFLLPILMLNLVGCEESKLKIAQDVAQEIIDAFIDKDKEALYSLFSESDKEFYLIREQIQEAFNFIDGKIISYELPTDTGGGGKGTEGGKVVSENMTPWIEDIETDSGKKYQIVFQYFLIFESDKNGEGISRIFISLLDENKSFIERVAIGMEWDDNDRFLR